MAHLPLAISIILTTLLFFGCEPVPTTVTAPATDVLFVYTTTYSEASYSVIDLTTLKAYNDLGMQTVHTDAAVFYNTNLNKVYILNRLQRDSIQELDPTINFYTTKELSTKSLTNPHSLVFKNTTKALITRYGSDSALIIDPSNLSEITSTINLSSYAYNYPTSTIPHMSAAYYYETQDKFYIALQRLDSSWQTFDYSSIVVIDGTSNSVSKNIKLQWTSGSTTTYAKNPYSKFKFLPSSIDLFSDGNNHLLIGCIGEHEVFDGGIIAIDLSNDSLETEYILSEADLSMDIIDFVILSETKGYVITSKKVESDYTSSLYSFNPSDKSIILIKSNTGSFGQLSSLLYHSANNRLFVTDRTATNPGVRVFDTLTDTELNGGSPVYVGLPPADMVVVE